MGRASGAIGAIGCSKPALPLFPETKGMINRDTLSGMKRSAFLINTSRGPLIVDEDLAEALNTGIIAGAGLDVLSVEPPEKR